MKLKCYHEYLIVAQDMTPDHHGEIIVPELARDVLPRGVVVEVSDKVREAGIEIGDKVFFEFSSRNAPTCLTLGGEAVLAITLESVIAKVLEEDVIDVIKPSLIV